MPEVFQKNCKITLVEYGGDGHGMLSMKDLRSYISNTLRRFIK